MHQSENRLLTGWRSAEPRFTHTCSISDANFICTKQTVHGLGLMSLHTISLTRPVRASLHKAYVRSLLRAEHGFPWLIGLLSAPSRAAGLLNWATKPSGTDGPEPDGSGPTNLSLWT